MVEQQIKEKVKKRYSKFALTGNFDSSHDSAQLSDRNYQTIIASTSNCSSQDQSAAITSMGYKNDELESIPKGSILGVGCGAPLHFANLKEGETVVDLGSGAGIDIFLSANKVGGSGKVVGIDMTDEMLEKASRNAKDNDYKNVEFRKGDIEKSIPVDDNSVDLVISNCVITLTTDKVSTYKEIYRILKQGEGRLLISDLITDKEVQKDSIEPEKWCSSIHGALTKENYIKSIIKAGFKNPQILEEKPYIQQEEEIDKINNTIDGNEKRKLSSIIIKAVKD